MDCLGEIPHGCSETLLVVLCILELLVYFGETQRGNVLILFLMLTWVNKLPNDTFTANLISLSVVGFGLSVLSVLIGVLAQIPIVGIVWGILGPFVILYIIYSLYNLTVAELLLYFVAYILVLGLMTISRILLLALLGAIVL